MKEKLRNASRRYTLLALMRAVAIVGMLAAMLAPVLHPAEAEASATNEVITYGDTTQLGSGGYVALTVIGQTVTNNALIVNCPNSTTVGVQVDTVSGAANTSNLFTKIDAKISGTNWVSNWSVITNTATGTTLVPTITTLSVGGIQSLRFSVTNEAAATVTNFVTIYVKGKDGL